MKYKSIETAVFLERPNRFIAYVELDGKREKVHAEHSKVLLVSGGLRQAFFACCELSR